MEWFEMQYLRQICDPGLPDLAQQSKADTHNGVSFRNASDDLKPLWKRFIVQSRLNDVTANQLISFLREYNLLIH